MCTEGMVCVLRDGVCTEGMVCVLRGWCVC